MRNTSARAKRAITRLLHGRLCAQLPRPRRFLRFLDNLSTNFLRQRLSARAAAGTPETLTNYSFSTCADRACSIWQATAERQNEQTDLKSAIAPCRCYHIQHGANLPITYRPPRATPMNRQVGPSIVLSVLIVCFFAVVFFEHEHPRSTPLGAAAAPRDTSQHRAAPASPVPSTAEREARSTEPSTAGFTARDSRSPKVLTAARALNSQRSAERVPRTAVTVVQANETIGDVARRVYGTSDDVDVLWCANRDALPHKDAPLVSGMVLRTPAIR